MTGARRGPLQLSWRMGLLLLSLLMVACRSQEAGWTHVGEDRLLNAEKDSNNWLMVNRTYDSKRYSPLAQINRTNVQKLSPRWTFSMWDHSSHKSTPIVNDGVMIVTGQWSKLYALDAKTGALFWRREAKLPDDVRAVHCCRGGNRGVAVLGDRIYWVTLDAHVVALEARTGRIVWDVVVEDYRAGYTLTVAPLIVRGKVVIGTGGGDFGIRGFIQALDVTSGRTVWKTYTIPAPGEAGSDTWPKDSDAWKHGGAGIWVTGSYDPELNLIYWGTGNPAPNYNGDARPGDNLYSSAVLALDADTGRIKWHYQWTPHDMWDYDGVNEMVLVDMVRRPDGTTVKKGLIHADRNGHFYLLDRINGQFIYARPFVHVNTIKVNANTGKVTPLKWPKIDRPVVGCPYAGKDWLPMSYSPDTGLAYVPAMETCSRFVSRLITYRRGKRYESGQRKELPGAWGHITALDVGSGETTWKYVAELPMRTGTVTTAAGLVFAGTPGGELMALDAKTGSVLWRFQTGLGIVSPPMTFAIEGTQYVAVVTSGRRVDPPGLADARGSSTLFIFGLRE